VRALFFVTLLASVCMARPASAQIYAWTDANGHWVLSNRSHPDAVTVTTFGGSGLVDPPPARRAPVSTTTRYDAIITTHARAHGVSPALVRAIIEIESGFNPTAVSPKGALGLMQLMPATARELGVVHPFEPDENIRGGVMYLRRLLDHYHQDVSLALAAYNAGPAAVARYGAVPPYRETRAYVTQITGATPPTTSQPSTVIYHWVESVDGRSVVHYSNTPPSDKAAVITGRR
jgi:soluble lytic murein transglycosylase-like protein